MHGKSLSRTGIVANNIPVQELTKTRGRFYHSELDALRFFAFLSVFAYHFSFTAPNRGFLWESFRYAGAFGMCLFFILSSYLITELLVREKAETGTIHVTAFYIRRILRIWPLYFLFIAGLFCVGKFLIPEWSVSRTTALSFVLLLGNWHVIYGIVSGPIMPLWSISLEEQFYILWPTLAKFGKQKLLVVSLLLILVAHFVIAILVIKGTPYFTIWWNSFTQFQYFGMGAMLALFLQGKSPKISRTKRIALFVLALLFWLAGGCLNQLNARGIKPVISLLLSYDAATIGAIMIFFAFLGAPTKAIPTWMINWGKISYGLYVFHELCIEGVVKLWSSNMPHAMDIAVSARIRLMIWLICSFALTVIAANLSFLILEKPFLRLKKKFEFIKTRTVTQ